MKIISYNGLRALKGITYSKSQLWRLERAGKFPKRVLLGARSAVWVDDEIEAWIRDKINARTAAKMVTEQQLHKRFEERTMREIWLREHPKHREALGLFSEWLRSHPKYQKLFSELAAQGFLFATYRDGKRAYFITEMGRKAQTDTI